MVNKYHIKDDSGQQYFLQVGQLPDKMKTYQIPKEPQQLLLFNMDDIIQPRLFEKQISLGCSF